MLENVESREPGQEQGARVLSSLGLIMTLPNSEYEESSDYTDRRRT